MQLMRIACLALAACGSARSPRTVVPISANAEWKPVAAQLGGELHGSPFGDWLVHRVGSEDVVFFHGGYGKVSAAGSTQYAIDRWHPALLVNLGTCGGFGHDRKVGDIVLVEKTIIYDILEQMGSADETIADYSTTLDVSGWPAALRDRVHVEPIVSGDRDLVPADLKRLRDKYNAGVGDWESGAIAWVAAHDHTRLVILRAVTDVISETKGDATYGDMAAWARETEQAMHSLLELLSDALPAYSK